MSSSKAPECSRSRVNRPSSTEGGAVFVRAGAEHRFSAYEHLAVLVLFDKSQT